jgi:hypothetical protein
MDVIIEGAAMQENAHGSNNSQITTRRPVKRLEFGTPRRAH